MVYTLHFDGSCGPTNPGGTAAYGFALYESGVTEPIETGHGVVGTGPGMTNNLAEFYALAMGLHAFAARVPALKNTVLNVRGDSMLVIKIMNRDWKAKAEKPYYSAYDDAAVRLAGLRRDGATVFFDWVGREHNQVCDDLSKVHQKR